MNVIFANRSSKTFLDAFLVVIIFLCGLLLHVEFFGVSNLELLYFDRHRLSYLEHVRVSNTIDIIRTSRSQNCYALQYSNYKFRV